MMSEIVKKVLKSMKTNGVKHTLFLCCKGLESEMYNRNWNVPTNNQQVPSQPYKITMSHNKLNIGIIVAGGLGDYLISANYIYRLIQKYGAEKFRVYILVHHGFGSAASVFGNNEFVFHMMKPGEYDNRLNEFDIALQVVRFPEVKTYNAERVMAICPSFVDYILLCEKFRIENERFFKYVPQLDGESGYFSVKQHHKRVNQADIYNHLGLTEKYEFPIYYPSEKEILEKFNLYGKKYVIIHRGIDSSGPDTSVKMWPIEKYVELVKLIKQKYPDLILIQIGIPTDAKINANLDYNFVGCTTLDEVKVLSKCCSILIDNEGGIVHLRHALGGGTSIVLFGATSPAFYGYSENSNVYRSTCPICCEWTVSDWQDQCILGSPKPPCMECISPQTVMDEFVKCIEEGALDD